MSLPYFNLMVRYGGNWSGLEYLGGEEELINVPAGEDIYAAVFEAVYHVIDTDTDQWKYIFDALVDFDGRIRRTKLRRDYDVINLFTMERVPIVFVSLRKIRSQANNVFEETTPNEVMHAGGSSSYMSSPPPQQSFVPLENNFEVEPTLNFHGDWGIHEQRNFYGDDVLGADNEENVDNVGDKENVGDEEEVGGGEDGGTEVNHLVREYFEEWAAWFQQRQQFVGNNQQTRPRFQPQSSTFDANAQVGSLSSTSRWIILGVPNPIDSAAAGEEDGPSLNGGTIRVGALFSTKEVLTIVVGMYHVDKVGEYRIKYSDKKRLKVICKSKSCPFTISCSCSGNSSIWRVYEVIDHECTLDPNRSGPRRLPSKILGAFFAPRLLEENSTLIPKAMMSELQQRNSVHATYDTALQAKHHAIGMIYGDQNKSFAMLPAYLHMLKEMNPGSITALDIDYPDNLFRSAFFALGASIAGFQNYGRPIIVVDGSHFKGKYNGIIFVAVTQDGNIQIFPLAVGIGHVEDDSSWTWFMEQVKSAYGSPENLVIMSDAHKSIANAVKWVFPDANHCLCYYHMQNNMKVSGKEVVDLFAKTCTCRKFEQLLIPCSHAAASIRKINHDIHAYVDDCYKTFALRGMWSGVVMPILEPSSWVVPYEIQATICLPPDRQRQAGRPRQSRYAAGSRTITSRKSQVCLRCGCPGHNSVTCTTYIPLAPDAIEEPQSSSRRAPRKCSLCRSTDHTKKKCPLFAVFGDDN